MPCVIRAPALPSELEVVLTVLRCRLIRAPFDSRGQSERTIRIAARIKRSANEQQV